MIRIRFLPLAEIEFLHEIEFYSATRAGTGKRFVAAVESAVSRAAHHPFGGAPTHKNTRSMLVKGFPFSVIYRASPKEILVVAIAPHRKQANYWTARVQ